MDYVERNLGAGEKILLRAKVNRLSLVPSILGAILLEIVFFVIRAKLIEWIGLDSSNSSKDENAILKSFDAVLIFCVQCVALVPVLKKAIFLASTKIAITNKRIIGKWGIIKIETIDFKIEKVDNVAYSAGFWGNIFKFYTLTFSGSGYKGVHAYNISNALEFKNKVTDAIEQHAEEARRAQAAEIAAAMQKN